jgi:hypothetical protein
MAIQTVTKVASMPASRRVVVLTTQTVGWDGFFEITGHGQTIKKG